LTQAQLAERLGKPQSFVAKVERGERRLDVVEFVKVVQSLGLIPSDFLRDYVDELTRQ
jgi:transcriptional regulator with XRE-family HTH domain